MELRNNAEARYTGCSHGLTVGDGGERNRNHDYWFMLIKLYGFGATHSYMKYQRRMGIEGRLQGLFLRCLVWGVSGKDNGAC